MSKKLTTKQRIRLQRQSERALLHRKKSKERKKLGAGKFVTTDNSVVIKQQLILNSQQYPIYECLINKNWRKEGIASIWISRKTPEYILVCTYVVDLFCLGLKNTSLHAFRTNIDYQDARNKHQQRLDEISIINCSYELVNQIIYGAINYANKLGFSPHIDFTLSQHILGKPLEPTKKINFGGPNGKPLYILGPHDNPREIIEKLTETVGEDGFEYTLVIPET